MLKASFGLKELVENIAYYEEFMNLDDRPWLVAGAAP